MNSILKELWDVKDDLNRACGGDTARHCANIHREAARFAPAGGYLKIPPSAVRVRQRLLVARDKPDSSATH